jgi:hypothetical protein
LALAVVAAAGVLTALPAAAGVLDEAITAHVTTASPQVGQDLEITGQVTDAPAYPVTVSAQREDSAGTTPADAQPTDAQGHFTLNDTPPVRGMVTYHLAVEGGMATKDLVVHVAGKPTSLHLTSDKPVVTTGHKVHLTAHLGSNTTDRTLTIYAKPYHRDRRQVARGEVDPTTGDLEVTVTVNRRTTFIAEFDGDPTYAPATARRVVMARAGLDEVLRGGYGSSGGYRLYHPSHNPSLYAVIIPEHKDACLYFRAQRHYSGAWHTTAVSHCVRTDGRGAAVGVLTGDHVVGQPYRLRAEFHGNHAWLARHGRWLKIRFRH